MSYITMISVTIIIAITVLGIKYLELKNNPDLYEQLDTTHVNDIIIRTIKQCDKYYSTSGDDKYKYSISEAQVKDIMLDIAYCLNLSVENHE